MVWGSQSFDPISDLSDITGKVIVVTGSSGGIGYATIQHLARHGAKVYMAARNEDKAKAAISRLHSEGLGPGNGEVLFLKLDLSDPNDVRTAADEFMKDESRLDVLARDPQSDVRIINVSSYTDFKWVFLTQFYWWPPQVSSSGISFLKRGIRFRDLDDFNDEHRGELAPGLARYCRSKLANVLFTTELQKRLDAAGIPIVVMAVDPGLTVSSTTLPPNPP
ncbi:uncharacterized protein FIBRA_04604 [Fibroporia radiculosa]|uniref:NAD(P)-binding protein n=1 Tax=Fibroporia radiculosa TaxID=599839 RepID=J4HWM1_9APHY|nr:uncharacterized protein FIBRA_04604 [Fibroporia radiculosa]CCM02502.1 predicted protein [Fibroporia radiculosa]